MINTKKYADKVRCIRESLLRPSSLEVGQTYTVVTEDATSYRLLEQREIYPKEYFEVLSWKRY
jgi:hypothetical protein